MWDRLQSALRFGAELSLALNYIAAIKGRQRPRTDFWFGDSGRYYPGLLFLLDTQTGQMIQFQTGQGDSELLFVRGDVVYYRVNTQLYAAQIRGAGVGTPQLLADHEAVADMHWAFAKQ